MTTIIPDGSWLSFAGQRPATGYVHLDAAAAGRSSRATLDAVAAHAELEATAGAYVAAASAAPVVDQCRADLAGLTGVTADGIAFTESATAALAALLRAWPLSVGDTVAVAQSEWGPNLDAFAARGLRTVLLPVDGAGLVDVDALPGFFGMNMPALVHLTPVSSHRPLVQPSAAVAGVCREFGIPLWVDAAQAIGHADVSSCGGDAVYGTSRKWLTGPRGVGFLGVAPSWLRRLRIPDSGVSRDTVGSGSPVLHLESREAHVAGRVGLASAVSGFLALDPASVFSRLASVGSLTRSVLDGVPGWSVVGEASAPSAITALRPENGQDVTSVRSRLVEEYKIVTTAALPARAPHDMSGGYLRVSPHVDVTSGDLERLAAALPAS